MTDQHLTDLLETAGDRHEVGSPPVDEILRDVRRRRRARAVLGGAGLTLATVDHRDPGAGADEGG